METFLKALYLPITTAKDAFSLTALVPAFLVPAIVAGLVFGVVGVRKKEKISRSFLWNLLPLLVIWIEVCLAFTVLWEKSQYLWLLNLATGLYVLAAGAAVWLVRPARFLALSAQSLIAIYSLGAGFLCGMAVSGKWL